MISKKRHFPGSSPLATFTNLSSIAVIVGIVVGTGIFRLPPIVANHSSGELQFILFWLAGGAISLAGALCYAELASSQPDTGGEYHFLTKAFGPAPGFLFIWGRMTVIQTGSIALVSYILGDYATLILDLGKFSSSIYAAIAVVILTGLNISGTAHSRKTQMVFTSAIIFILVFIAVAGIVSEPASTVPASQSATGGGSLFSGGKAGLAMIFVLLTYGGWNEAAYLSGELINVRRNMVKVLIAGIVIITSLYVLINMAYLHVLGFEKLKESQTVGADLTGHLFGAAGSYFVSFIVILSALSTVNATIITGARTNYALGRDFKLFRNLGVWNSKNNAPVNALLVQGIISLMLIILGAWSKRTVETMVDYTAPVFWLFLFLTTGTIFFFRKRNKNRSLPYRVPLYPLIPAVFLVVCAYMLYSSIAFTGKGALIGAAVLITGIPGYLLTVKFHHKYPGNKSN